MLRDVFLAEMRALAGVLSKWRSNSVAETCADLSLLASAAYPRAEAFVVSTHHVGFARLSLS